MICCLADWTRLLDPCPALHGFSLCRCRSQRWSVARRGVWAAAVITFRSARKRNDDEA